MRPRNKDLGRKNICGARVEFRRHEIGMKQKELLAQLQVRGVDMSSSALSKIEGQIRSVSDYELLALSEILNISTLWLLKGEE